MLFLKMICRSGNIFSAHEQPLLRKVIASEPIPRANVVVLLLINDGNTTD